jgi:integrase
MARPKKKIPSYLPHPASGQARVRVNGRDFYLGPFGSPESKQAYARFIAENFGNGGPPSLTVPAGERLSIAALVVKYDDFARLHYVKDGAPTDERYAIKAAVAPLVSLYGDTPADEFSPKRLKAVRQEIIDKGRVGKGKRKTREGEPLTRKYINYRIACLVRIFKWVVEEELVPVTVYQSLKAVTRLQRGRTTGVRESIAVKPVPDEHIPPVLAVVSSQIAAMIRLQLLTGMRPDEVTIMRPADLDRSGDIWVYRPRRHKTEHHGIDKLILLGPKAQEILLPWLERAPEAYLFSPKEVWEAKLASRRRDGKPAQPRRRKRRHAARPPCDHYNDEGYCQAVERACKRAGVPKWTPGRLRHNAGTKVRAKFGAEAAQLVLGHQNLSTTEIYAEKNRSRYEEIMREIG